ncbi:hypothetical protein [Streptomyces griseomycini]|uniref:Lipoprotein n=1 Tax=Streptomyces griseomycini TaxID=66895 RepID=A0A7W7PPF2_9ACTN|nr:hypothetical protein [Streptomyces griseomycini]MBB4897424.1 hypothetical protein [Streptomyces griseomycini]
MAQTRRRLRSSTVVLGGMGVLATALSACGSDPDRRCVDRDSYDYINGYRVVADKNCKKSTGDDDWYYDADVSNGYADHGTFSRSEAVDRGGFGCSASGSGGG